ncbi:chemotaxis protein CheW [Maritimibacter sp. DP07]|uniref:Chemotaxis protein CheW n=1 Tax=Maritimibacter harenae TaxID=2606218 RepID=A0A845M4A7_9RHOB|nr:chemotaxis protein CheW [Maritimibacter harenae]MZR15180.1 chemotaxis protein CheW [Maritimibacter harenae]
MTLDIRTDGIADTDVVTFRLSNEVLAVPAAQLREVLEPADITRVPGADDFVGGLLNVRGAVVPLADLRVPLRMPRHEDQHDPRILVLELPLADQDMVVGIFADSVHDVTRIAREAVEEIPPVGTRWPPRYVAAVGRCEGEFVTIPDLSAIFTEFLSGQNGRIPMPAASGAAQTTQPEAN